jgi:GDP-4-dehydro-6-deoxy-D-mannose reductase
LNKIVIIGGNYLTVELEKKFKKNSFRTYVLTRKKKKIFNNCNQYVCNYLNKLQLYRNLEKINPNIIINLVSYYKDNINISFRTNIKLPLNLLSWIERKKNSRLILIGSAAEYGDFFKNRKSSPESSPLKPTSVYALTKTLQSLIFLKFYKKYKSNIILIRIFNLFGKIFNKEILVGKINNFIKSKNKNKILKLGNLSSYRDYISIKEAAKMIATISIKAKKGSIYNVGSGKPILVRKMVYDILKNHKINKNKVKESLSFNNKRSNSSYIYANINKFLKLSLDGYK